ncbi:hypothetical protein TSOC_014574, partial [Tetrabaena socialis]
MARSTALQSPRLALGGGNGDGLVCQGRCLRLPRCACASMWLPRPVVMLVALVLCLVTLHLGFATRSAASTDARRQLRHPARDDLPHELVPNSLAAGGDTPHSVLSKQLDLLHGRYE